MPAIILFILLSILSAENITLDLKWKNAFQFAGFYMAKEKGFYKKYDLNVTFKELSDNNPISDVLNNKAQFGIANSSLIYYKLKGKPVIALMPVFENTPIAIVSTDPSVKTLKDLKGEIIHSPKMGFYNIAIIGMLKKAGIDISTKIFKKRYLYYLFHTNSFRL
ncbi:ABC transporter substrate-binding protein [Lebetimonas sp. JH292]|uniref:ABC transporter substrate-binding protein n=1 Tax=Lebetimonas sp. JH292 TaxID=990068 RepID=UPI0004642ADF|nr:ABC transporter substrate-binding protein [Lebetimonas sp. JH292]